MRPFDVGAEPAQPSDEVVVAALDVLEPGDGRLPLGDQAGEDQAAAARMSVARTVVPTSCSTPRIMAW